MQISGHYAAAEVFFFPSFFSRGLVRWLICALQWNERAGSIIPCQNCLFFRRFFPSFPLWAGLDGFGLIFDDALAARFEAPHNAAQR